MQLTIEIGDAHVIKIDQRNHPDARTHQTFRRPGSDATHADHHDMRARQPPQIGLTNQPTHPIKPPIGKRLRLWTFLNVCFVHVSLEKNQSVCLQLIYTGLLAFARWLRSNGCDLRLAIGGIPVSLTCTFRGMAMTCVGVACAVTGAPSTMAARGRAALHNDDAPVCLSGASQ